jgi:hypothetical protein
MLPRGADLGPGRLWTTGVVHSGTHGLAVPPSDLVAEAARPARR